MLALAAARTNAPEKVNPILERLLNDLPGHAAVALEETGEPKQLTALRTAYRSASGWERDQLGRAINVIERRNQER
jgi:hypothetical protein